MNPRPGRLTIDDWSDIPIGVKPDGSLILSFAELPALPIPKRVVIGRVFFEIDGWVIAYPDIRKGTLRWFGERMHAWRAESTDETSRDWLHGIADALCEALLSLPCNPDR